MNIDEKIEKFKKEYINDEYKFQNIITLRDAENSKTVFLDKLVRYNPENIYEINIKRLHTLLLENIEECNVVLQPYSFWGNVWASLGESIPPVYKMHADCFFGEIPCTKELLVDDIETQFAFKLYHQIYKIYNSGYPLKKQVILIDRIGPIILDYCVDTAIEKAIYLNEIAKNMFFIKSIQHDNIRYMQYELMTLVYGDGDYNVNK